MSKKHKTQPVQPPKADTNIIVIPAPLNVPMGHRIMPRAAIYQHKNQHRLNTRQAQVQRALKDW